MSPILGIYASQISGHLFGPSGAYDSIATTTVGAGGAASITFSSIPSTYTHLQIRGIYRSNYAGTTDNLLMRFNGDTGANYAEHILRGDGSSAGVFADANMSYIIATVDQAGNTAGSNVFGVDVIDILDYANTSKYKVMRNLSGRDNNGDGGISLSSGLWQNTNAISTIVLYPRYGTAMQQYSQFALYGVKGQ